MFTQESCYSPWTQFRLIITWREKTVPRWTPLSEERSFSCSLNLMKLIYCNGRDMRSLDKMVNPSYISPLSPWLVHFRKVNQSNSSSMSVTQSLPTFLQKQPKHASYVYSCLPLPVYSCLPLPFLRHVIYLTSATETTTLVVLPAEWLKWKGS